MDTLNEKNTAEVEGSLTISHRAIIQLASSAIGKNPINAIVELITNSDDSYSRLEKQNTGSSGNIRVEIIPRRGNTSIIKVIDEAQGLSENDMDRKIRVYGDSMSGLTEGENVRGYFGRGLKESMIAAGRGTVKSIKDGVFNSCALGVSKNDKKWNVYYRRFLSEKATLKIHQELGVPDNGTEVSLWVSNDDIKIPHHDTLIQQLRQHYQLRFINTNPKRKIKLIEKNIDGRILRSDYVDYKYPKGTLLLKKEDISIPDYPSAKIDIEIWRADEPLTQDNYRPIHDGGLLIHGKNTIYDSTLFKYNSDVFAAKLFGKVRCDYLDTLLKNDDMIIEGSRYGLDGRHSFNKKLSEVICKELEVIVKEERKLAESQKERDLNEKTKQRFRKAVDFLNKIAQAELKGAEGDVKQEDDVGEPDPKIPDEGFGFVPDYYHIQTGKKSVIILRVLVPKIIENGAVIKLSSTSSEVIIDEAYIELNVNQELSENGVQQFNIPILGKQVGSIANIMAKAQDHVAVAQIKVVSQPEETKKEHTPKIKKKKHGIFNEIKYDPTLDPSQRAYFDEASGDIKIATKAASVDLYLEPHTESPETLHCQVLVAEIVLDTVVKVLIKQKRDRSLLVALTDKGIVDMIENEKNKLISKYSADVHRALVDNKAFRKKYE